MAKDALPERYTVDRRGTPDPEGAEYFVLDVVHDRHARVALGRLAREYQRYGQSEAAHEVAELLDRTSAVHGKLIQDQYEARNAKAAPARGRPRTRR